MKGVPAQPDDHPSRTSAGSPAHALLRAGRERAGKETPALLTPAGDAAWRLPGKPLLRGAGKYLVQHVYERACRARADAVVVATDDPRIVAAVESFGGRVV